MKTFITYQKKVARKHLGQYFLQDKNIIKKIISYISPKKDQELIEIGPGLGALTQPICQYIDKMNVIEIDIRFINFLKNTVFSSKLNFFNQDVMKFNFYAFSKKKRKHCVYLEIYLTIFLQK